MPGILVRVPAEQWISSPCLLWTAQSNGTEKMVNIVFFPAVAVLSRKRAPGPRRSFPSPMPRWWTHRPITVFQGCYSRPSIGLGIAGVVSSKRGRSDALETLPCGMYVSSIMARFQPIHRLKAHTRLARNVHRGQLYGGVCRDVEG